MHIRQSLGDVDSGDNLFSTRKGKDTKLFLSYIAGLQKHLPAAMALTAPNVNSYRRTVRDIAAPTNTHWGHENRTVGLRIPDAKRAIGRETCRARGCTAVEIEVVDVSSKKTKKLQ